MKRTRGPLVAAVAIIVALLSLPVLGLGQVTITPRRAVFTTLSLRGSQTLTGLSADVPLTPLLDAVQFPGQVFPIAPSPSELYLACVYAVETQAATSSSTMPGVIVTWSDGTPAPQLATVTASSTANAVGTAKFACIPIWGAAGSQPSMLSAGYASSGATPMTFDVHTSIVRIQ